MIIDGAIVSFAGSKILDPDIDFFLDVNSGIRHMVDKYMFAGMNVSIADQSPK